MKTIETKYRDLLGKRIHAKESLVPFYSSVLGSLMENNGLLSTSYWVKNLTSPVLFSSAVSSIVKTVSERKAFLEVGPHSALAGPVRQTLRSESQDAQYIATLIRNEDGMKNLLKAAGELWASNVDVNLEAVNPPGRLLTDLPTYAWNYDGVYWYESRLSKEWRQRKFPHHDVLGYRVPESTDIDPTWRNMLSMDNVPWMVDHEIANDVLFPGAGYIGMAGEAIRQITDAEDYTVRSVNLLAALVVNQGKSVEVNTHLRKARLTDSLDSEWYEFSIVSLHETGWTKHCVGQVRGGSEYKRPVPTIASFKRKVPSKRWYRVMSKYGLNYGPRFQGLSNISADVSERKAAGVLHDKQFADETPYQLHPTTLDSALHLFGVAVFQGVERLFNQLSVPTGFEELYVKPCKEPIAIQADGEVTSKGGLHGNLIGVSNGEVIIDMKGLRMSPLGDNDAGLNDDPHAAVELEWNSDINFLNASQLMRPAMDITEIHLLAEKLALACMIQSRVQLASLDTKHPHLEKFRTWLRSQEEKAIAGQYPDIPDCASIAALKSFERAYLIEELYAKLKGREAAPPAIASYQVYKNLPAIFEGSAESLDILMEDNILTKTYDFMQLCEYSEFFELLGHSKPNMKILEIGAGTGGTTSTILPHLQSAYGERIYGSYTYTDISAGFFVAAKQRFKDVPGMEFAVLDISKDPIEQGFEAESFDLIVGCNVLHATPVLKDTLSNVRKLLSPRGRLLMQELDPTTRWINYVMGILPGWWLGEADGRPEEPYVSPQRWDVHLKAAGFAGVESAVYDGQLLNNIIARPVLEQQVSNRITVLCRDLEGEHLLGLLHHLRERAYEVDFCTLNERPVPGQTIVSAIDLEGPFLYSATEEKFDEFRSFFEGIQDSTLLWLTGAAQIACKDPNYSLVLGMARSIRNELRMDLTTLELENFNSEAFKAAVDVLHELQYRARDDDTDPVMEYAYHDGRIQVGRFHWMSISDSLLQPEKDNCPKKLEVGRLGFLQSLAWNQLEPTELKSDWVEIDTRAVGLNFKDILMSMGIVDMYGRGLGVELSGIVRKVGSGVADLKPGYRVLCATDGAFCTINQTPAAFCAKLADGLTFAQAATMPAVYSTVIYSLMDTAHLRSGQVRSSFILSGRTF